MMQFLLLPYMMLFMLCVNQHPPLRTEQSADAQHASFAHRLVSVVQQSLLGLQFTILHDRTVFNNPMQFLFQ